MCNDEVCRKVHQTNTRELGVKWPGQWLSGGGEEEVREDCGKKAGC